MSMSPGVRAAVIATAMAVAIAFVWFVWPTPYMATVYRDEQVNRITGARCAVGESCWLKSEAAEINQKPRQLPFTATPIEANSSTTSTLPFTATPIESPASKCPPRFERNDWDATTRAYWKGYHDAVATAEQTTGCCWDDLFQTWATSGRPGTR